MGSCCTVERSTDGDIGHGGAGPSSSNNTYAEGYNSIMFHQENSSTGTNFSLVYRPPSKNGRLAPGEAKPKFWVSPYGPTKGATVVSVAWGMSSENSYIKYITRNKNAKRNSKQSFFNACLAMPGSQPPPSLGSEFGGGAGGSNLPFDCGDNNLSIKTYPEFLLPFVNKTIRLRLVCLDSKVTQLVGAYCHLKQGVHTDPSAELSHLVRNMHWLRLHMTYRGEVNGLPHIEVEEHHGGVKRLRKIRYRLMAANWIDMDHRKPTLKVIGDSFMLRLEPPPSGLQMEDFPEGNGELPSAVGVYIRGLDTAANSKLEFAVRLFQRHNQHGESADNAISRVAQSHECFLEAADEDFLKK